MDRKALEEQERKEQEVVEVDGAAALFCGHAESHGSRCSCAC